MASGDGEAGPSATVSWSRQPLAADAHGASGERSQADDFQELPGALELQADGQAGPAGPGAGRVLYAPSEQDSPEVQRVLRQMQPFDGYDTLVGHVVGAADALDGLAGAIATGQILARLNDGDGAGESTVPVVMAVCRGDMLGAAVRRDSGRAVWMSPSDVYYTEEGVIAGILTPSGTLDQRPWRLLLPRQEGAAAAALWPGGVRPMGSASVVQWQLLGERGLYPVEQTQLGSLPGAAGGGGRTGSPRARSSGLADGCRRPGVSGGRTRVGSDDDGVAAAGWSVGPGGAIRRRPGHGVGRAGAAGCAGRPRSARRVAAAARRPHGPSGRSGC